MDIGWNGLMSQKSTVKATILLAISPVLFVMLAGHLKADELFTYTNGAFTTINIPDAFSASSFGGINDSGQIVGWYDNGYKLIGLLYSTGAFSTFSYPNGSNVLGTTIAKGINDAGQISGTIGPFGVEGYVYQNGMFTLIRAPGAGYAGSYLSGINNNGQVVGDFSNFANQYFLFIYSNGSFTTIPAPGPSGIGFSNALNDADQIVGGPDIQGRSFEYTDGLFATITFPGAARTTATGINDSGEIVGSFIDSQGAAHGFVDINGVFTVLDFPGAVDTQLTGVNNLGEIVGTYTPVPEHRSGLLFLVGIAIIFQPVVRTVVNHLRTPISGCSCSVPRPPSRYRRQSRAFEANRV